MSLEGARMLVVGASAGIGRQIGLAAARAGASVAFAARRKDRLDDLVRVTRSSQAVMLDVTDRASVDAGVAEAVAALGGLDVVVFTSGVASLSPLAEETETSWRRMLDTNVVGAASVAAAVVPHLDASGVLLFTSSTNTHRRLWGLSAYGASKAALDRLAEGLRDEHPTLRIVRAVIGPTTGTEFGDDFDGPTLSEAMQRWVAGSTHTATMMEVEDVGEVAVRLLAVLRAFPTVDIPVVHLDPAGGPMH
jgi:NADP-dependent 3-hydroxy acid dehydrogenase YdfG